ncbi:MAG: hypothetical protein K2G09_02240, partial [Paramuribaculum sp.]|nr:hypothetical protein [Paramuribaculum sp.]
VYYFPKKINIRKKWNVEQSWDINELPLDQQKPFEIKKNKPKTKDAAANRRDDEEEEEDDGFFIPGSSQGNFNNSISNSRRTNGRNGLRRSDSGRMAF